MESWYKYRTSKMAYICHRTEAHLSQDSKKPPIILILSFYMTYQYYIIVIYDTSILYIFFIYETSILFQTIIYQDSFCFTVLWTSGRTYSQISACYACVLPPPGHHLDLPHVHHHLQCSPLASPRLYREGSCS